MKDKGYQIVLGYEYSDTSILEVLDEIEDENFGVNFDVGHAVRWSALGKPNITKLVLNWIDLLKDKIVEFHVHGVFQRWGLNAIQDHDPLERNNTFDYRAFIKKLKEFDREVPIIFEIMGKDVATVLKYCRESKEELLSYWYEE